MDLWILISLVVMGRLYRNEILKTNSNPGSTVWANFIEPCCCRSEHRALKSVGRVELGIEVIRRSSPPSVLRHISMLLNTPAFWDLVETFYYMKNETRDLIAMTI